MITKTSKRTYESPEIQTLVLVESEVLCGSATTGSADDFNVVNGNW